jgi:hypothetical protein
MDAGTQKWRKNEWFSFAAIILFLTAYLLIIGYPIINWDSQRYLRGALFFQADSFSLTFVPYLLHPLVIFWGAWGFAFAQIILLAYIFVSILQFFHKSFITGFVAVIMSAAAYYAISVMMDIYTAAGLLTLFLILNGKKNILLYVVLGLCSAAHYENIPLFILSATAYWAIFYGKKINFAALSVIMTIVIAAAAIVLTNYIKREDSLFLSKARYVMTVPRFMADFPLATRSYMEKYPGSYFGKNKEFYEFALTTEDPSHTLLWGSWHGEKKGLGYHSADNDFFKETESFVAYILRGHKLELAKNIAKKTFQSLLLPGYEPGLNTCRAATDECVRVLLPGQLKSAVNSLPYIFNDEQLPVRLKLLYVLSYYTSFAIILFFLLFSFVDRRLRELRYYPLVVLSIIVILVNALLTANIVDIALRYQLRVMLLPCFAMNLIAADLFKYFSNLKAQNKRISLRRPA